MRKSSESLFWLLQKITPIRVTYTKYKVRLYRDKFGYYLKNEQSSREISKISV